MKSLKNFYKSSNLNLFLKVLQKIIKKEFNNSLMRVLEKYEEIMNIILTTLREER